MTDLSAASRATATHAHTCLHDNERRLQILIEKSKSRTRLCLRGTLDTKSAASAYDAIIGAAAEPCHELHLDLTELRAATRAGSRAINVAAKLLHRRGGRLTIFGVREDVVPVLKTNGFDALIVFRDGPAPTTVTSPTTGYPHLATTTRFGLRRDRLPAMN